MDRLGPTKKSEDEQTPARADKQTVPQVSTSKLTTTAAEIFGRVDDLAWLDGCWRDGVRVATIVAMGGAGKSSLVNSWWRRLSLNGWQGAQRVFGWSFYNQGTDRGSSEPFSAAALEWFGYADTTAESPWARGERLARLIREQRTLLILDGLEALQWGPKAGPNEGKIKDAVVATLVKELAALNPGMCVITSRIKVADVAPFLGLGSKELELKRLSAKAGAQLLRKCGATGSDAELQDAAEEYDGHCLALTLLGNYAREALPHRDIRKREHIPPLKGEPAQRMMATYEDWFDGTAELAILRMLGLFNRPATQQEMNVLLASPQILGITDTLDGITEPSWNKALTKLRDVGLVAALSEEEEKQVVADPDIDAHPLVREYFGERLRKEYPNAWREGHHRLYQYLRQEAKELPDTVPEMVPLYTAVVHGCRAGSYQDALEAVYKPRIQRGDYGFNSRALGAYGAEIEVLSAFFEPPWDIITSELNELQQAYVLNGAGYALRAIGRLGDAAKLFQRARDKCIKERDWDSAAKYSSNLSGVFVTAGELSKALREAENSVQLADRSGSARRRMSQRTRLGDVLQRMGQFEKAAAAFAEAELIQRNQDGSRLQSVHSFRYCDLLLAIGQPADVLDRAKEALDVAVRENDLLDIALAHLSLGQAHLIYAQRGEIVHFGQARFHLQHAVDGLIATGRQDYLPRGQLARAELFLASGEHDQARKALNDALSVADRCGMRHRICDAYLGHARLALAMHNRLEARGHLTRARKLVIETSYHSRDTELADLDARANATYPTEGDTVTSSINTHSELSDGTPSSQDFAGGESQRPAQGDSTSSGPTRPKPEAFKSPFDTFDVVVVCALHSPELEKVLETGKQPWKQLDVPGDPHVYHCTSYITERLGKELTVIAAAPNQMGLSAAAVLATKMILRFRPKLVAMVGIAAGVKNATRGFGDILAAEHTFDYGSGKSAPSGDRVVFLPDPKPLEIGGGLLARLKLWSTRQSAVLDEIRREWRANKPETALKLHIGPLASGAAVIDEHSTVDAIRRNWRKLVGLEMEAYAVHRAVRDSVTPAPEFVCVKSICDFAEEKSDDWQHYAAFTAAQFFHRFIVNEWETLGLNS